ncbi:MAG: S53 family peptidase [Candidatus Obscuribacterales bacterium]|nr:S53 family peptidase [Candidatus Obscuribacterales bacterium]
MNWQVSELKEARSLVENNGRPDERATTGGETDPESQDVNQLQDEAREAFEPRYRIVSERAELLYTRIETPEKGKIGPSDPEKEISATIVVRSRASDEEFNQTLAKIARHEIKALSDSEYNAKFAADPQAMARVLKFAADNGLSAAELDSNSGRVLLKGKVKNFKEAFKVKLDDYKGPLGVTRERSGLISVPKNLANDIEGVFGLESKSLAHSNVVRRDPEGGLFRPRISGAYMPSDVADAYQFPHESKEAGQGVAILEFGGGIDLKDNAAYYAAHGLKVPEINIVGINGAKPKLGGAADDEVALDSQILGVVAPDAKQMLIFAANSEQGFVDAVTRASFTKEGETPNSAISISWGAPESAWTRQAIENLNLAFKKAALKGISVFAATGDTGAKNSTSRFTADYPASDPFVTGTGGSELSISQSGDKEIAWNNGGGGISEINKIPDFQAELKLPENANKNDIRGRGVPDIAGNANPAHGYRIRVRGQEAIMGGTSSVAPLYAGLVLRLNSALGERVGYLNPYLYKNGNSGIFRDITSGNNEGYDAGPGWDAVTGWGSINGSKLLESLKSELKKQEPCPRSLEKHGDILK